MVLHNYEYFVAIVEAGSLTKAAEHLYVSQPSLSQYLKRLEASLGVELFDRSTSPLRLTYTGERYYQYVLQMMKLDENVRREFQDIKTRPADACGWAWRCGEVPACCRMCFPPSTSSIRTFTSS